MGRRSKMSQLLLAIEASDLARERTKVMLLTLGGGWSVKDGMAWLSLSRTRFQLLRRRMLEGALLALGNRVVVIAAPDDARELIADLVLEVKEEDLQLAHLATSHLRDDTVRASGG